MKVYLIKASAPGPFKEYKKYMGSPPQNIFSLAAATPPGVQVDMCDETVDMKPKWNTDAEVVAIMFHTPDATHAYAMAAKYRAKGKTVVLGGIHPTALPDEAQPHADALLLGECEGIWEDLLSDYKAGTLKSRYQRTEPVDMGTLRPYPTDIISPSRYGNIWTILVSRGCVHRCEYCAVPPFFKGKYRLRPVEDVVEEIKAAPTNWFELHADNLTANRDYAVELFKALTPLNINWMGESTIKMAEDEELLRLAAESGCRELLIGIETPSKSALAESGKGFVSPEQIKLAIDKFHDYNITITSSMIFGFDSHTPEIFQESLDFANQIGIDEVESVILCPFPGTPLHDRMAEEGRLLHTDWAKYDCSNAVFKPIHMTPDELDSGAAWFWKQIGKKWRSSTLRGNAPAPKQVTPIAQRGKSPKEVRKVQKQQRAAPAMSFSMPKIKWKTLLGLTMIGAGIYFDWPWIWGIFALIWVITDLRQKTTYLLEEVPRATNPILYWIIILLWLFFAAWSFYTTPMGWELTQKYAPAINEYFATAPAKIEPKESEKAVVSPKKIKTKPIAKTTKQTPPHQVRKAITPPEPKQASGSTVTSDRFAFSLTAPKGWNISQSATPYSLTIQMDSPDRYASALCIALDIQKPILSSTLIDMVEKELAPDLPFIVQSNASKNRADKRIGKSNTMIFREYHGTYQGLPIKATIGFVTRGSKGIAVVGLYGPNDTPRKQVIEELINSFTLTNS